MYVVVLAVGGIAATLLTVLVYRAGNTYQGAVKADADARIAEAGTKAAEANAQAARANEGLGKSNEEIARLTTEAEQAKTERAEADKQIAIAKADAARAKEGTANAEAVSAKASVEVARLQVVVANAEQKRAEAQKALLELQERLKDRHLTAEQQKQLAYHLKSLPRGQLEIRAAVGSPDARNFALEFVAIFQSAGWQVSVNDRALILPTPIGVSLWLHTERGVVLQDTLISEQAPIRAKSIIDAFGSVSLPLEVQFVRDVPKDELVLVVGFKP